MPNTLRVKRGLAATLPNGASGEPLFTTDTYELYIGKGDGTNQRYQKYIASGTTSQYLRGDGSLETHNLDSLTDVVVSSPSNGQFLKYNGTNWVNSAGGFLSGGATAAGQVGVFDAATNIVGYTTFTYDTVTDKLSMTNGYVNNTLTVDGQLVIKSESGASAYTRGLKFPDNSYGGTGDIAGLRLHNAGGENIILELYAGNDSLDTINFAVAAGGSTYNDNVTINGNKIWNAGNLPSPLSSTGTINSGEIPIFSNSTTVYSDTALFWDNSLNRLGVGGTSPNAQVGVSTSSGVNAFGYRTSGASYYELVLAYDNTTYGHTFQANRGASTSARNITFLNGSNTISIDESGNMGIGLVVPNAGTSGPGGLGLDIYASTTAALALHNSTSGTGISAGGRIYYNSTNMTIRNLSTGNMTMTVDNGNFTVITLGAENIKVEGSTGKVGIGAPASIAEMLTVNGSIQQSGVTSSMLKANASGKIIAAVSNTDFQAPITLTTTGTSGAATFNGTTLNIPQYQAVLTNPVTGSGTNNEIAYFNATGSTIASLSTATYPSLTELSYVKGVTSSIQTQLNGKQNTLTNPVTGTGTSGYHAKFTVTGSTIGNSLIYDNGVRAISIGNSSTNPWASPFYVIEGGTYGQFIGFQTNNPAFKLGTNSYFNGSNYIYTNTGYGVGILDVGSDATNAYLDFYGAPTGTAGNAATISKKFSIDNTGNAYFVESLGVGFTTGTINGRIDFRNPGNAIIVGKNTTGGTNTYSSIRLTTANSGGVGDSIGEIRGISTNSSNRDIALTFLTTEGSGSQTEKMRITSGGHVGIGVTPSAWMANSAALQVIRGGLWHDGSGYISMFNNAYYDGTNWRYISSTTATNYAQVNGTHQWFYAASGTAGNIVTFNPAMIINTSGNVGIGTTSPGSPLTVVNSTTDFSATSRLYSTENPASVARHPSIIIGWGIANVDRYIRLGTGPDSGFGTPFNNVNYLTSTGKDFIIGTGADAATLAERMRITSGGDVVIGATSFSGVSGATNGLEIAGVNAQFLVNNTSYNHYTVYAAADSNIYNIWGTSGNLLLGTGNKDTSSFSEKMRITSGGNLNFNPNNATAYININQGSGLDGGILFQRSNSNKYQLALTGGDALYIYNYATGSESMRITSGGNVGIGTTTPRERFDIAGLNGSIRIYGRSGIGENQIASNVYYNGSTWTRDNTSYGAASIILDSTNGQLLFNTTSATSGYPSERMRINSNGEFLVGTTVSTSTDPVHRFGDNGGTTYGRIMIQERVGTWISLNTGSSNIGTIYQNGSVVVYGGTSDYRLKENIKPMINGIDRVMKLKPVEYTWKRDGSYGEGFIAHELQEIVPLAVTGIKDGINEVGDPDWQNVDKSHIVPILVKAIQEQQAQIEELKSKLN